MPHHQNIRAYMLAQRRERTASKLLQTQKLQDEKLRIRCALERVSRQAEKARRSSGLGNVYGGDGVSSVSGTKSGKMPKVVRAHLHSPFSDVTNHHRGFVDDSLDDTSRPLFGGSSSDVTGNVDKSASKSDSTKSSVGKRGARKRVGSSKSTVQSESAENDSKENNPVDPPPNTSQSWLDPRRKWELEPLQNAIQRFAMSDDSFQPVNQSIPKDFSIDNGGFGLCPRTGRGITFTLNHNTSNQKVSGGRSQHSVILLCLQNYIAGNADLQLENKHDKMRSSYDTVESNVNKTLTKSSPSKVKVCIGDCATQTEDINNALDCNTESSLIDGSARAEGKLEQLTNQRVQEIILENCNEQKLEMDTFGTDHHDDKVYEFQENKNGSSWIIRVADSIGEANFTKNTEVRLQCLDESGDSDSDGGYESSFVSED